MLLMSFLTACGLAKKESSLSTVSLRSYQELVKFSREREEQFPKAVKATLSTEIETKQKSISTTISFYCAPKKGIRLVATTLLFLEVGRLWILPEKIILYDKLHKTSTEIDYATLQRKTGYPINYQMIESILLGRFFPIYLEKDPRHKVMEFTQNPITGTYSLLGAFDKLPYQVELDRRGLLSLFQIGSEGNVKVLNRIDGYQEVEQSSFPDVEHLLLETDKMHMDVNIDWRKVQAVDEDDTLLMPKIKSSVDKVSWQEWIQSL